MATTTTQMAAPQEAGEAEQHWLEAKKITHSMVKKLEQLDKDEYGSKKLLAELESVEHLLESLRLACMATTFTDFQSAHKNRVLDRLWHVHTLISTEYKKGLQRHRGHGQIVQFRTIEKQYAKHLKTAQYFYKGFIERLSARYRLRSLQRVAHTMQSGNLKISDVIDAEEAHLGHELTVACYRTVLHMGDIARYRLTASRQKGHNPDVAMTYYALAQDLMPEEGDAHHQMAVVLAEQRRDFDVVYHFLRSWSVQKPFALAPKNLASEFKKLLQPPSSARKQGHPPPDAYDTFGSWLVRLHAHYFKGEDFSSQGELEREVLHRWETLLKKAEQPAYLQKAVLMNLAAYDIARRRVQEQWTATSSQSCQFILQFIVRTILVLSRVLETESNHLFDGPPEADGEKGPTPPPPAKKQPPAPAANEKNDKSEKSEKSEKNEKNERGTRTNGRNRAGNNHGNHHNAKPAAAASQDTNRQAKNSSKNKSTAPETCLSLFRICVAWISTHNEDLVKFEAYLSPHIVDMHRSVTRCLTLFIDLIAKTDALPTAYLLPEDVEVIGLAPLDGWTALHEGDANSPYKPHFDEEGVRRKSTKDEIMARIYDMVECMVRLISDPAFPWILQSGQVDGREVTKIAYAEDRSSAVLSSAPPTASSMTTPAAAASCAATTPAATATASPSPAIMRPAPAASSSREGHQLAQRRPEATPVSPVQAVPAPMGAAAPPAIGQPMPAPSSAVRPATTARPWPLSQHVSYKDMDDDDFLPGSMKEAPAAPVLPIQRPSGLSVAAGAYQVPAGADPELDLFDSAAYSRVATFLSPPELHPHPAHTSPLQSSSLPPPSSYGMHTSTIEDVFGQLQTPSTGAAALPAAAAAAAGTIKPIPSSPWGGSSYMNSLGYYPQQQQQQQPAAYGQGGLDGKPTNIEDQLAYLTLAKQQERQLAAAAAAASASAAVPLSATSSSYGMDSLSRGFPSALSPVGAAKQQQQQQQQQQQHQGPSSAGRGGEGFVNPWAASTGDAGGGSSGSGGLQSDRLLPQQLQQAQAASLGIGGAVGGMGRGSQAAAGSSPAMLYSSHFSMNSSLPAVQSPQGVVGMGLGAAGGGARGFVENTFESIYGRPGSSSERGGSSSGGYAAQPPPFQPLHALQQQRQEPQQPQSQPQPQPQLAAFGGYGNYSAVGGPIHGDGGGGVPSAAWQDAATAWGRGLPLGKDDPTHFRNAVRQSGLMDETNTYDRNALLSALDDGMSPARPR